MGTLRQEILDRVRRGPCDLHQLAREFGLREKETAEHLGHALRSLATGERLGERPAACLGCGFAFRKRARLSTPSRCPRCRNERIEPATFWIERPAPREP